MTRARDSGLTSLALASPRQALRARPGWSERKQLYGPNRKGFRQAIEQIDRGIAQTALDPAHIGAIDFGRESQRFLGHAALQPKSLNIAGNKPSGLHAPRQVGCRLLIHGI